MPILQRDNGGAGMNRWMVIAIMLGVLGVTGTVAYRKGHAEGEAVITAQWSAAREKAVAQKRETENALQTKADKAGQKGNDALVAAEHDADRARTAGDRLREQLSAEAHRADAEGARLTGERKAAAQRERVLTELLGQSTRAVEQYARAADQSYQRGLTCEEAWPTQ